MNHVPTYATPVSTKARWEDVQSLYLNSEGREVRGNSRIYLEKDIAEVGDQIYLGESVEASPPNGSKEIRNKRSISNLRGTRTEHRVIV